MRKLLILVVLMGLALAGGWALGHALDRHEHDQHWQNHELVYATCQLSRTGDLQTEKECADAQFNTKIEYICKEANTSPATECWTQDNNQLEEY